jgi:tetratricopeptide (TPR) repeat protein
VATSLNNLAKLLSDQKKYGEAEPLYLQSLEIMHQGLGENHPSVEALLRNISEFFFQQLKFEDALLYEKQGAT